MAAKIYDLIIIGAGAAGMTAAIYAARYKLDCLVLGPEVGGTANLAHDIENWPGFKGAGMALMERFKAHAASFEVPILLQPVAAVERAAGHFIVRAAKQNFKGLALVLAMGTRRRKLGVPGEKEFYGRGVSYCATCDCVFYKNMVVGIVGGADAAAMAAQILSQHAARVIIIYRQSHLRAEPARVEELENDPKVEFIYNANVVEILGDNFVKKVKLDNGQEVALDGIFIEIGGNPQIELAGNLGVELAANNRIQVDQAMGTSTPGVFAAGDITTGSNEFNQIVTAAAEGAIATLGAFNYIRSKKIGKPRL